MAYRYSVTAVVDSNSSVQELSKIFEGLQCLRRDGAIRYTLHGQRCDGASPRIIRLHVQHRSGPVRTLAIDLTDQRDLFDREALESVDIYFKRSFWPDAVRKLPARFRRRVWPFGLNNPAITSGAAFRLLASRLRAVASVPGLATEARQLFALPAPAAFERHPDEPAEPLVIFQTRVWASDEPDVLALNDQRVQLVRTLRRALGDRFIGGVIPSSFASRRYRDVLTPLPYAMRAYPRLVRRALIGVYSQGLHRSVAFKLSEYLAASCCIVADQVGTVLPTPLEEGRHYLRFDDPEQCAAMCHDLLANPNAAREMRQQNWEYHRSEAEPGAQMLKVLDTAFQ